MIDITNELFDSYLAGPQFSNMWNFSFLDWEDSKFNISTLKVISTSLPFVRLENESHSTGHKYYSGYKMPDNFSVSFREDTNFSITRYFKEWEKSIFDIEKGCFISSDVEKTRNGILTFSKFALDEKELNFLNLAINDRVKAITQQALKTTSNKVIDLSNRLPGVLSGIGRQATTSLLRKESSKADLDFKSGISKKFKELVTRTYCFNGIRYLGISNQELSYDTSEELVVTVNFAVDTILEDENL